MYKIQVLVSEQEKGGLPIGEPYLCSASDEALIKAIIVLCGTVSNGEYIVMEKVNNSTHIYFWIDCTVKMQITPNVLAEGVIKVGPKSLTTGLAINPIEC